MYQQKTSTSGEENIEYYVYVRPGEIYYFENRIEAEEYASFYGVDVKEMPARHLSGQRRKG